MGNELKEILEKSHRPNNKIVSGDDPKKLVEDMVAVIKRDKVSEYKTDNGGGRESVM
jgi:hypothetical protein